MLTHLMPATHPLPCAPHLPLKAVTPASYTLHKLLLKKGSLSTCQLIEWSGRSLTWLPLLHCSAIQAACPCFRFKWATWIPPPPPPIFVFWALAATFMLFCVSVWGAETVWRYRIGLYKDPRCVWNGLDVGSVFCGAALLLNLDLLKSPYPPPSTVLLNTRGCLYNSRSPPIMVLTSPSQFSRGTGRSQNGKLPPCIGRHWMIIMAS